MESSKQYLKDNDIVPRISFKKDPKHTVKLLNDKIDTLKTNDGETQGVKYLVEEGGEKKTFFTGSVGLIQKLSDFNVGDTVVIEMKSINKDGNYISVFEVSTVE
ncbi:unnamed protein product, partial [marine sediment metagenome]